jgi:NhaP-type Na+/H+ or K+/H+ antiporter
MKSLINIKKSIACMLLIGILIGALAIGLVVACLLQDKGTNWIASVFVGAGVGVCVSWFLYFLILHNCIYIIHKRREKAKKRCRD